MSLRLGLRSFSARRRRTISRDGSCVVSLTGASASSSGVQRARPAGGLEQAVATSRASLPAGQLALRPIEVLVPPEHLPILQAHIQPVKTSVQRY
jgi:hypothetical protein